MSEPINSGFPFPGMESSEELDISAIFGGSAPANDINPFDTPTEQFEGPAREPANPISAAIDKQETQTAQTAARSLFEKPPIFSYGSAQDEFTDGAMTFEELRIAKSDDFPELGEGKRVSWSVEYGKVTKQIADPKGTTIQSVKEEIERSKVFLDGLKKSKDKRIWYPKDGM